MPDHLTVEQRSALMRRITGKHTKPELFVRRLIYAWGFRFRLHSADLPGKPDIVFRGRHKAIFVHGCFWHQHEGCSRAKLPKSRSEFWKDKMSKNIARDRKSMRALRKLGWQLLIIWECQLKQPQRVSLRIRRFLNDE